MTIRLLHVVHILSAAAAHERLREREGKSGPGRGENVDIGLISGQCSGFRPISFFAKGATIVSITDEFPTSPS